MNKRRTATRTRRSTAGSPSTKKAGSPRRGPRTRAAARVAEQRCSRLGICQGWDGVCKGGAGLGRPVKLDEVAQQRSVVWVSGCVHGCVCVCLHDPVSGRAMFKAPFCANKAAFLGHWGCVALLFDIIFDTVELGEGQGARPKKRLKGKIQTSRASKGL